MKTDPSSEKSGMKRMKGNNFSVINLPTPTTTRIRLILIIGIFASALIIVVQANTELYDLYEVIPTSKANTGQNPGGGFNAGGNPLKNNLVLKRKFVS